MPVAMYCILAAMMTDSDGDWTRADIAIDAGYAISSLFRYMKALEHMGWIDRPFANRYRLTERGKIAFAVQTGRITRLRARKLPYDFPRTTAALFRQYGLLSEGPVKEVTE